jgi:hypothetical protein
MKSRLSLFATTSFTSLALAGLLVACGDDGWGGASGGSSYGGPYGGSTETSSEDGGIIRGDGAPSAMPMLAKIDPSASMVQTPGQGVGVFTQYDPGGHWYVWWTCDTDTSYEACDFEIKVSVAHGEITGATPQNFEGIDHLSGGGTTVDGGVDAGVDGGSAMGGSSSVTATTTTTTSVQGIHFDTAPDAVITLSAALGGEYSGAFLFFVEDAKVNGGYTGTVSDPLELQSSSP